MFVAYADKIIDDMLAISNPEGTLIGQLELIRFYLYWAGCYF